jgi:hypothetical protein
MKKLTIPSGPTAAHGHSGSLDRSPARTTEIPAFGRPMPSGACGHHVVRVQRAWHSVALASVTMAYR